MAQTMPVNDRRYKPLFLVVVDQRTFKLHAVRCEQQSKVLSHQVVNIRSIMTCSDPLIYNQILLYVVLFVSYLHNRCDF